LYLRVDERTLLLSPKHSSRQTWFKLAALYIIAAFAFAALAQSPSRTQVSAQVRLGLKLFRDARFSSPQGDLQNSCASCHLLDEDPQGMRAHTDFFARSWVPWRGADPRREGLRNAPTILDSALMPRLHFDGEFGSLEELVKGTLAGRPMGWLPGEQDQAFDRVYQTILKDSPDSASSYSADFKAAYGVDPAELGKAEVIDRTAKAIADYIRTQKSSRSTAYDRFVEINGLSTKRAQDEDRKMLAGRILGEVAALEKKRALKLTPGFGPAALKGLKVFFRTDGTGSIGNCASCHAPPLFTDFSFHNMGISQGEYDRMNGNGAFAALEIPDAGAANRPSSQFREIPSKRKPEFADLGHWNFVDLKSSPQRRTEESDDQFLRRMIASFKTPSLRNLAFTQPYMHTGGFTTIESALSEIIRLSDLARAGRVRSADEELARIRITEADIPSLVAFLNTLNENFKPRY
jgi:cytochrome c peroxidase